MFKKYLFLIHSPKYSILSEIIEMRMMVASTRLVVIAITRNSFGITRIILKVEPNRFTDEIDGRCKGKRKKKLIQDFGLSNWKAKFHIVWKTIGTAVFDFVKFDCLLDMSNCQLYICFWDSGERNRNRKIISRRYKSESTRT